MFCFTDLLFYLPIALILDRTEGVLPARSRHSILATVKPIRRVNYQFAISYKLITPNGKNSLWHESFNMIMNIYIVSLYLTFDLCLGRDYQYMYMSCEWKQSLLMNLLNVLTGQVVDSKVQEPQHLCHVLTTGVFPVMAVSDARCYGSAVGISKKQLWALFSLDKYVLNQAYCNCNSNWWFIYVICSLKYRCSYSTNWTPDAITYSLNLCLDSDPSAEELRYSVATRHRYKQDDIISISWLQCFYIKLCRWFKHLFDFYGIAMLGDPLCTPEPSWTSTSVPPH